MNYITIILLGYAFNIVMFFILSVLVFISLVSLDMVKKQIFIQREQKLSADMRYLKLNKKYKYRQKDFLGLIPFASGLYMIQFIISGLMNGFINKIVEYQDEELEYLETLK